MGPEWKSWKTFSEDLSTLYEEKEKKGVEKTFTFKERIYHNMSEDLFYEVTLSKTAKGPKAVAILNRDTKYAIALAGGSKINSREEIEAKISKLAKWAGRRRAIEEMAEKAFSNLQAVIYKELVYDGVERLRSMVKDIDALVDAYAEAEKMETIWADMNTDTAIKWVQFVNSIDEKHPVTRIEAAMKARNKGGQKGFT
jgi:hypothetical protein